MYRLSLTPLISLILLSTSHALPADPTTDKQAQNTPNDSEQQWLEEVRAQRKAWEQWRAQAKQASDERLRQIDPWGAMRLRSLKEAANQRREAMAKRSEELRRKAEMEHQARREAYQNWFQPPNSEDFMPYGWDNRWYYRGY